MKIENEICLIYELWCQNAHGESSKEVFNSFKKSFHLSKKSTVVFNLIQLPGTWESSVCFLSLSVVDFSSADWLPFLTYLLPQPKGPQLIITVVAFAASLKL